MSQSLISTGPSISFGWETVKKNFWYFVGVAVVSTIISSLGSESSDNNSWDLVGLLATTWMTCGTTWIYLQMRRGTRLPFSKLFTSVESFLPVLGASLLYYLIVFVGLIFLIVPGIYFGIKYQFTVPLIIDKKLGVFEAMRHSAAMTQGRKMSIFGFDLVMIGVVLLGVLCLGVGIFVAIPVAGLASIDLYEKLQTASPTTTAKTL